MGESKIFKGALKTIVCTLN